MANIQVIQPGQGRTRKRRTPSFPLAGGMRPFGLYPIMFTPVLPGETLDAVSIKETLVSSTIVNPLAGAWAEVWLFFVRLTDIDRDLSGMFLGQLTDPSAYQAGSDKPRYFTKSGGLDWCYLASSVCHKHFFLDEGEAAQTTDGVHKIKRIVRDFTESAVKQGTADGVAEPTAQEETTPQLQAYLAMRQMGMASFSYEDYLKTYGVNVEVEEGQPELLEYRRYWTAPSNVIDPATGAPSGAWYWRVDEQLGKRPKMFKEHGFVIALQAVRPKLFDASQVASYASQLWGFADFVPSYTLNDPTIGIREMDADGGDVFAGTNFTATISNEVWFDHHDLLMHGEQFINGASRFTVPTSSYRSFLDGATDAQVRGQYATETDIDALFTTSTASERVVDYEGLMTLGIKGHVQDNT